MKTKVLGVLLLILTGFYACQTDELETIEETNTIIAVDLKTFVASQDLDATPKGKYVGVIGHHTNPNIHGKIFINAGQHNQYNALVEMTDGKRERFAGRPQTKDGSVVYFRGSTGSFTINLEDFENPILSSVQFNEETSDGYLVVQKSTGGADAFVLNGTYVDETNPNFTGNWDLIGDGNVTVVEFDMTFTPPGLPFPVTLTFRVPTENIGTLSISHTGSTTPFIDTTFETNAAQACIEAALPGVMFSSDPFVIPSGIPNPADGTDLGGAGSVSAGGQTSTFNGSDASWSLSFGAPIPAAMIPGGFSNDDCTPATSGTWSWNGRTGTISISGI